MSIEHYCVPASGAPYLVGGECASCGTVFFPRKRVCPVCQKEGTIVEKRLSRKGRIHSFSYCTTAPPGVKAPYLIGLIDLPEGPRVLSIIFVEKPSPASLRIGDEVELIIESIGPDEHDHDIINYMFRPVKGLACETS